MCQVCKDVRYVTVRDMRFYVRHAGIDNVGDLDDVAVAEEYNTRVQAPSIGLVDGLSYAVPRYLRRYVSEMPVHHICERIKKLTGARV